jgi:transposase-like protein
MPMAQLIITAVTVEGRTKSEVARDYRVSRYWVQQLVQRYEREGPIAFQPRSRRPHSSPDAVDADTEEMIIRLRKQLSKQGLDAGAETIAAHLARCQPAESGRSVPAVSTIWRICRGVASSIRNRRNGRGRRGARFALSSPTNAGRPTSLTGSWPTGPGSRS